MTIESSSGAVPGDQPTAVSLFSGCGGLCEGIRLAGFNVLAAVEWDRYAAQTYRHNFPEVSLYEGDVSDFRRRSAAWSAEEHRFRHLEGREIDLVFGGPPCQGYSQIGPRDVDDERNVLYGQFVRVLRDLRPRVFLMENVPNMLMLKKGLFKNRALAALRRAGYSNCDVRVLHATDFGVPQLRKRAVFFGVRDDIDFPFEAGSFLEQMAEQHHLDPVTVWQAIGDLPAGVSKDNSPLLYPRAPKKLSAFQEDMRLDRDGQHYSVDFKMDLVGGSRRLHNHHTKEIQERRAHLISLLAPGLKADSLPKEIWDGARPEKWRRLHPDKPAYTILAQMHRDLSEWVHPKESRWITVREAARLQSFHDGFVFQSSEWQMLKQIGNAVPPLLGRGMGAIAADALTWIDGGDVDVPGGVRVAMHGKVALAA